MYRGFDEILQLYGVIGSQGLAGKGSGGSRGLAKTELIPATQMHLASKLLYTFSFCKALPCLDINMPPLHHVFKQQPGQ